MSLDKRRIADRIPVYESCREWVDNPYNRCNLQADFILWGKLFDPEALGPRCYVHAVKHIGQSNMSRLDQWAVFDLRGVYRDR